MVQRYDRQLRRMSGLMVALGTAGIVGFALSVSKHNNAWEGAGGGCILVAAWGGFMFVYLKLITRRRQSNVSTGAAARNYSIPFLVANLGFFLLGCVYISGASHWVYLSLAVLVAAAILTVIWIRVVGLRWKSISQETHDG